MASLNFAAPQRLRVLFLATMAVLSATVAWLGWNLLEKDDQLAAQRVTDRREAAADAALAALERRLSWIQQSVSSLAATGQPSENFGLSDGNVAIEFTRGGVRAWPEGRLLYYPDLLSGEPDARAEALAGIARDHLNAGRRDQALQAFAQVSSLGAAIVAGMPAALAGPLGALAVFVGEHDDARAAETARALNRAIQDGQWHIAAATYRYISEETARSAPPIDARAAGRRALSAAAAHLWDAWIAGQLEASGRLSVDTTPGTVLIVWQQSLSKLTAVAALPEMFQSPPLAPADVALVLTTTDGRPVSEQTTAPDGRAAVRLASATGLPWNLQVFAGPDVAEAAALQARRRLYVAGLGILVAVVAIGGWFMSQSVARQLAVARLQSDFVSAVSHEFRTPLTTLCQLSELLVRGRVATEPDRQSYYELLHGESDRLRRLVERLLDFGRLESGRLRFEFERLEVGPIVQDAVTAFSKSGEAGAHHVELSTTGGPFQVRADVEALRTVLWNVLSNAVKYSPQSDRVDVAVRLNRGRAEIAVRDYGGGIARDEQRLIFERFVRGSSARTASVRGTGIGLAMSRQISRAHGGDILVDSEPGKGSTFTVVLPLA